MPILAPATNRGMKTIPTHAIELAWAQFGNYSAKEAQALAQEMQEQQPYVLIYLLAASEPEPGTKAAPIADTPGLMELGAVIYRVMADTGGPLRQVTPEQLEAAEQANLAFLEKLDEGPEAGWMDAAGELMRTYRQAPLLFSMIEALMAEHEENPELAPDSVGKNLLHLKTVIDCLDQEQAGPAPR
jgi:hypothetical protein